MQGCHELSTPPRTQIPPRTHKTLQRLCTQTAPHALPFPNMRPHTRANLEPRQELKTLQSLCTQTAPHALAQHASAHPRGPSCPQPTRASTPPEHDHPPHPPPRAPYSAQRAGAGWGGEGSARRRTLRRTRSVSIGVFVPVN